MHSGVLSSPKRFHQGGHGTQTKWNQRVPVHASSSLSAANRIQRKSKKQKKKQRKMKKKKMVERLNKRNSKGEEDSDEDDETVARRVYLRNQRRLKRLPPSVDLARDSDKCDTSDGFEDTPMTPRSDEEPELFHFWLDEGEELGSPERSSTSATLDNLEPFDLTDEVSPFGTIVFKELLGKDLREAMVSTKVFLDSLYYGLRRSGCMTGEDFARLTYCQVEQIIREVRVEELCRARDLLAREKLDVLLRNFEHVHKWLRAVWETTKESAERREDMHLDEM